MILAAVALAASLVSAQVGEVQLGVIASYGGGNATQAGAGLVLGIAPGRIGYVGVRWTYQIGTTREYGSTASPTDVRNRSQAFAVDLGLDIPAGALEVMPGISLGAMQFGQRVRQPVGGGTTERTAHATEFLAAPGIAVEMRLAGLAFIPEVRYAFAGDPELAWPASHHGLLASVRLVLWLEVGRIRR